MTDWKLPEKFHSSFGDIAYHILGNGPPVVLVHGTPSRSYLWRHLAGTLRSNRTVYVFDLLGYGDSERSEAQNVSIEIQSKILTELLHYWDLGEKSVSVVGHDIGGAVVLAAELIEGYRFKKIVLLDAVITTPWITETTRHQQKYLECYRTMPTHIYEEVALAHLRTAFYKAPDKKILMNYFSQWKGVEGQAAWYRKVKYFNESITDRLETKFNELTVPIKLLWGEHDAWLAPEKAREARSKIPGSELEFIPKAGHFSPEDNPDAVSEKIHSFFADKTK